MDSFVQYAQRIVKAVSEISPFPISLSDEKGYIIGDTNISRIGSLHKPSIEVIQENNAILYDNEKISKMNNVLPGVAVPLTLDYKTVGVLGIIGDPKEVEPYADLIKKYVEMMWNETIRTHIEDLEAKTIETFVQYILLNETVNKERVREYCRMLQIDYSCNRYCILIDIGDSLLENVQDKQQAFLLDSFKKTLLDCVTRAFGQHGSSICAFLNTEKIVLLNTSENENEYLVMMKEFMNKSQQFLQMLTVYHIHQVSIAAGNMCSSIDRLYQSYHEAESLTRFGRKTAISPAVYTYYNWKILLEMLPFRIDSDMHGKLLLRLRPLLDNDAFDELRYNFITYCDNNMNISKAAKALYIHRNTLIYRLKKIDSLTLLNTSCFEHCTLLYLVLKNVS
ncbi:PucR family transcriptional regulator [Virgibacillus oceani]|uniref:CdaR family transcriptional regulator n=1 Tax=Virgibacillus oceani TaxID=1479511 RepID=A0A917M109_9BACI|nr:sugar diacid recognition domain-containing protein [Virgibacillus oceani]GGG70434.1 CdaR family transcriptional regulator [Virgibacillus oceani]